MVELDFFHQTENHPRMPGITAELSPLVHFIAITTSMAGPHGCLPSRQIHSPEEGAKNQLLHVAGELVVLLEHPTRGTGLANHFLWKLSR